jgi:hypothetical protein
VLHVKELGRVRISATARADENLQLRCKRSCASDLVGIAHGLASIEDRRVQRLDNVINDRGICSDRRQRAK